MKSSFLIPHEHRWKLTYFAIATCPYIFFLCIVAPFQQTRHSSQKKAQRILWGEFFFLQETKGQNGKEKSSSCAFSPGVMMSSVVLTLSYSTSRFHTSLTKG